MMIQQLMIASVLMVGIVRGTPTGSPNTCCEAMIPGHGPDAQDGKSVFTTIPNAVRFNNYLLNFVIFCDSSSCTFFIIQS